MSFPIALLKDDFTDSVISPLWAQTVVGSATLAETTGQMRFTLPSSTAGAHGAFITSTATYDLTGDSFYINIQTMVSTSVAASAYFDVRIDSSNILRWLKDTGTLIARHIVAGVTTDVYSVAWNATNHKYLRFREASGTVYWETSTNGTAWTTRHSMAAPFATTALYVFFGADCGNVASPGSLRLDDVNLILPAPSSTWRYTTADWSISNRLRPVTLASTANAQGVLVTADTMDSAGTLGGTVRYFAGPLGSSSGGYLQATEYASLALAQASAFQVPVDGRIDLPAMVDARYMRLYHRSTDASTHTLREFVPRRIVQAEDIEAESIEAINIAAGAVTADKIFVLELAAIAADMGTLHMTGFIDIEPGGGIYQGTGSAASPTTGLKIYESSGIGKLSTYNATVEQIKIDTDGRLKAGAGAVRLDATGIGISVVTGGGGVAVPSSISWYNSTFTTTETYIWSDSQPGAQSLNLVAERNAGGTKYGSVKLTAEGTTADAEMILYGALSGGSLVTVNTSIFHLYGGLQVGFSATGAGDGDVVGTGELSMSGTGTHILQGDLRLQNSGGTARYLRFYNANGSNETIMRDAGGAGVASLQISPGGTKTLTIEAGKLGFYASAAVAKPTVTGAKGGNAALASLLTALSGLGLLTDSST